MLPNDPDEPRLSDEAEELLANWPAPDRPASDWEALAAAIGSRIRVTEVGDTSDTLLEAPLPDALDQERSEGRRSRPRMKRPSEGSLVRLAQASVQANRNDAERDALAQSLLSQAVRARSEARASARQRPPRKAEASPTGERVPAAPMLVALSAGPAPSQGPAPSRGPAQPASACHEPIKDRLSRHERSMWFGVAFGMLGMAAAAFMYVSRSTTPAPELVVAKAGQDLPQAPASAESARAQLPTSQATSPVSIEAIPPEGVQRDIAATPAAPVRVAQAPGRARARAGGQVVAAQEVSEPAAQDATPPAAGPSERGMLMADSKTTNLPDKPSTGAVQVAIGTVMGAARACVAGQEGSSRASVRFGSNGRVANVEVSGPAAGTSAGQCVKSALGGARVQPFSRPSFVVDLSIRPR